MRSIMQHKSQTERRSVWLLRSGVRNLLNRRCNSMGNPECRDSPGRKDSQGNHRSASFFTSFRKSLSPVVSYNHMLIC